MDKLRFMKQTNTVVSDKALNRSLNLLLADLSLSQIWKLMPMNKKVAALQGKKTAVVYLSLASYEFVFFFPI